jgi:hypothetical protein
MVDCPVCGTETDPSGARCPTCHLATSLFEAVKEAAGPEEQKTEYARTIAEILSAVGPENVTAPQTSSVSESARAILHQPARFPSPSSVAVADSAHPSAPSGPKGAAPLPELPALAPGSSVAQAQRQIEELIQIGRRVGLDLTSFEPHVSAAMTASEAADLEPLRRDLFVQVAAALTEDYEVQMGRRNELAALVPTPTVDTELASGRSALSVGDLAGAQRRLRQVAARLGELEEEWATSQILVAEAELILRALDQLGVDPGSARSALDEGRRLARSGDTPSAERALAGANRVLWEILAPPLAKELAGIRDRVREGSQEGRPIEPVVRELRQMAALIRRRNFGAAISSYERLREAVGALGAAASP